MRSIDGILSHSIPHNPVNRQAELSDFRQNCANSQPLNTPFVSAAEQAHRLYSIGLNVFPQPYGRKAGYPWKPFQYTRLHPDDPHVGVDALFSGRCNVALMCGRTSGNLFVIDCESETDFQYHRAQAQARGIPLWTVGTARGGHLYFRCIEGEVANIASGTLPNAEVRGCRCYVLTAGSLHPSGVIYHWHDQDGDAPPLVSLGQIDWLYTHDGAALKLRLDHGNGSGKRYNPLSRATQEYLTRGDSTPQGQRNNALFRAACDLAGNGYAHADAEQILYPIAERSGLPHDEIYATITSAYHRPRNPSKPHQTTPKTTAQHDEMLPQYIHAYAEQRAWKGRTGSADYALFMALIERARVSANENGVFRASTRELSQLARIGINTTQNALKRLQTARNGQPPLIFYAGRDTLSSASLWRFSDYVIGQGKQALQMKTESLPLCPQWISDSDSVLTPTDALERGAMGVNGMRVYRALLAQSQPVMPSALAEIVRLERHQVSYALSRLRTFGVVMREKRGWVALSRSPQQLDQQVALPAGKLGAGERRRQRYACQRARFAGQLARRAMLKTFALASQSQINVVPNFIEQTCEKTQNDVIIEEGVRKVVPVNASAVHLWRCPNCGQVHFAETPPDMCDYCRDFTTWQPYSDEPGDDDGLVLMALELGGTVYRKGDDGVFHLYAMLPPASDEQFPYQLPLF